MFKTNLMQIRVNLLNAFFFLFSFCFALSSSAQFWEVWSLGGPSQGYSAFTMGDVDGDGDLDIVGGVNSNPQSLTWFENITLGDFATSGWQVTIDNTGNYYSVELADVDNDGDLDVIWGALATVAWAENDGSGNFGSAQLIDSPSGMNWMKVCLDDLDNDSDLDILVSMNSWGSQGKTVWYENLGGGSFGNENVLSPDVSYYVATSDVNQDGLRDVLIAEDSTYWCENLGAAIFTPKQLIYASNVRGIENSDIDNDGDEDILLVDYDDDMLLLYENTGSGIFVDSIVITTNLDISLPKDAYTVDVDNDNDLDIVCSTSGLLSGKLIWIENLGNLTFGSPVVLYNSSPIYRTLPYDIDDDGDSDIIVARVNGGGVTGSTTYFKNLLNAQVSGLLFIDVNQNSVRDSMDVGIDDVGVFSNPVSQYAFTYQDGRYFLNFGSSQGAFDVYPQSIPTNWALSTPNTSYQININNGFIPVDSVDFGFYPAVAENDLSLELIQNFARCNDTTNYTVDLSNIGSTILSGIISIELDDSVQYYSADISPDSIINQTVYWHFDSLFYFDDLQFNLQVIMPDFNSIGDQLISTLAVTASDLNGTSVSLFENQLNQILVCAYDPNDKQVVPRGDGPNGLIPVGQPDLTYTIRFQNTGNDTAKVVRITDEISSMLDISSFELLAASHPMTFFIDSSGFAEFLFNDIMLPDSNVNWLGSQGFVRFKIRLKPGVQIGDTIDNIANIYFDLNPAVITNSVRNVLRESTASVGEVLYTPDEFLMYPNPTNGCVNIELAEGNQTNVVLMICDLTGKIVHSEFYSVFKKEEIIDVRHLESGTYVVSLKGDSIKTQSYQRILLW